MIGPSIDPSELGVTGLLWLFFSYGYVLYYSANMISEGSELLLLIPSMAGLVGGIVLPVLGAVPDGAIILFSGLGGTVEEAQESLSVGVGALVGSTVMLLTVPLALSIIGGRVDLDTQTKAPNYLGNPKLTSPKAYWYEELFYTGVGVTDPVKQGGIIMCITTLPYFLIQIPASFMHGPDEEISQNEYWWAALGLVFCLVGLIWYMRLQLRLSREGDDRDKRMAVMKKILKEGAVSLSGALAAKLKEVENIEQNEKSVGAAAEYLNQNVKYPPPAVADYLREVLWDAFRSYDSNRNGQLDRAEVYVFFRDFHESISETQMNSLFDAYDADKSGFISLDEFIGLAYNMIKLQDKKHSDDKASGIASGNASVAEGTKAIAESAFAPIEVEEIPEELTSLSPKEQQGTIKRRAFFLLFVGSCLVVYFSDPMVDVLQEFAVRANVSPFYVGFVLAPLASNSSEVIGSMYYASKKTTKTITVSMTSLEGAACMNNTFCLSIFMALILFRGLAWHFTAETIVLCLVQFIIGGYLQRSTATTAEAVLVLCIFPASLLLVAALEVIGLD